ncbi:MAG: cob(I)yrinic acid a,c-diamide adenosyltransferase [Corynebacterium sp.]|nr:cob(I)yrinic acid a,c-diamide adenosyltransferase [Corynebacterium sp.]
MAVHLTKIYTRTGDNGTTALSNFERVSKNDPRLQAYAACDELNAALGVVVAVGHLDDAPLSVIRRIQNELFDCGADLATPIEENPKYPPLRISADYISALEADCDAYNEQLPALDSFILPGGTPAAAYIHMARTICRRAEALAWVAVETFPETTSKLPAQYLNRLSDLLFILGRVTNGGDDVRWVPGASSQANRD